MKSFLTLLVLAISTIFATVKSQNNQWSYYGPPHDCRRIIQQDQLKGGVGYIPLSTAQMKRGVYLCSVFFDGIHVSTEKIIKL